MAALTMQTVTASDAASAIDKEENLCQVRAPGSLS
jgi:hypothetical protein